jgi:hypothetical protein
MELTKQSAEVMSIDTTYNTNSFGYPLYRVTGLSGCDTVFDSVFGLVNNEKTAAFESLAKATKELRARYGIEEDPIVIITDQSKEMKAALAEVFPGTQQQLCIFHIIKNVLPNAKTKYQHRKDPQSETTRPRARRS